jgi:ABC-2 type transport system ATP-binding protein
VRPLLEARSLGCRYGASWVVQHLSLAVGPGEVYALLGANGAGKTTTLSAFLGFVHPSEGSVHVSGVDVAQDPDQARQKLGYLPEQVALAPHLTALETMELLVAVGTGRTCTSKELSERLSAGGVPEAAHRQRMATLSKGTRQKVALAALAARGAEVLLLDEPTSGLDPLAANELSALVREACARGAAVLMATHDLFRAAELGTRVGILRAGRLVQELDPRALGASGLERLYLEQMRVAS